MFVVSVQVALSGFAEQPAHVRLRLLLFALLMLLVDWLMRLWQDRRLVQ